MIQPKKLIDEYTPPVLHKVGCMGKITSFKETEDGRYAIELKGLIRFNLIKKLNLIKNIENMKLILMILIMILMIKKKNLNFLILELIFKDLKSLFEKRGFIINWKELEKQSLDETINALAMASPFSLEEKQVLLEAENLKMRKNKIAEILSTYTYDVFNNTTLQ